MNVRDVGPRIWADFDLITDPRCYEKGCWISIAYDIRRLGTSVEHGEHENPLFIEDSVLWGRIDCPEYAMQLARDYVKRCHDFEDGTDDRLNELLGPVDLDRFTR